MQALILRTGQENCALLAAIADDPPGYGRIVRDQTTEAKQAIIKQKDISKDQLSIQGINTKIMIIPNAYLHEWLPRLENNKAQHENYLTDIITMAVKQGGQISSSLVSNFSQTIGVNSKRQLAKLERVYQKTYAEGLLDQGVQLVDSMRIDIRGQLNCGTDVEIDIGCLFEGIVFLAEGVKVHVYCALKNVIVAARTVMMPYSLIEDTEIGEDCRIGPYARIRLATRLNNEVHIDNFVEVNNSLVATDSKINHLNYIDDSIVGANANVGVGAITCNNDGANKHPTIIEDDVFIESDTELIAPVKISKGSTIGAGSAITKEIPENQLTLSHTKQISITGWQRLQKNKKIERLGAYVINLNNWRMIQCAE